MSLYDFSEDVIQLNDDRRLTPKLKSELNKIQEQVINDIVFSRFKYYTSKRVNQTIPDSKYSVIKFKEGNCVGFAYYTRYLLHKKGFKDAVIVSSSPPRMFKRTGYLHASHAAVILPYNNGYILFDGSFYFPRIAIVNIFDESIYSMNVKNVYSKILSEWKFQYYKNHTFSDEIYNNGHCIIPRSTPYILANISGYNNTYMNHCNH